MENKASNLHALIGISYVLKEEHNCTVYTEKIPQGFKEPCFFVETVNTYHRQIGYRRYERIQGFCIHYFPKHKNNEDEYINPKSDMGQELILPTDQCLEMAENLYFTLESIKINGGRCRGFNMNHTVSGEVLHFNVNYNYHLLREEDSTLMKKLKQKGGIRNER